MLDRCFYSSGRRGMKQRAKVISLLLVFIAFIMVVLVLFTRIRPLVVQIALSDATDIITLLVNDVITEKLTAGDIRYDDLVELKNDQEGKVTALVTNMSEINLLQAEITKDIVAMLTGNNVTTVYIPLGSLMGGTFFSGIGPKIKTEVLAISNVITTFENEFSSAGINQTRHRILINVSVVLSVSPFGKNASEAVDTKISVAETVIVGSVPETYMSFAQ